MISTITATQVYKVISPIVRKNVTDLIIFKLRNYADLEGIVEELAALTDKKVIHNIYRQATAEPFAFLYVNLTAKDINKMFWINFDKQITVDEEFDDNYFNRNSQHSNPTPDNFSPDQLNIEDLRQY